MKILLVHPSNTHIYQGIKKSAAKLDKKTAKTPPIGLMYLAAVLQKKGYSVEIFDAEARNMEFQETINSILNKKPDIVGMTATTPLFDSCIKIAEKLKEVNSNIKIVLGGPHITALPKESLSFKSVDFVIMGEGEYTMLELVETIEKKGDFSKIKGVGYKEKDKNILNPVRELITNLDELPFPARDLIENNLYLKMYTGKQYTLIVTTRGCPYSCTFCDSAVTFGHRARFRSAQNVIDEIKGIIDRYGIRDITFTDDTFTLDKKRTIEICKKIIENKLDISFICSSRANTIDEERLSWLKKAGCWQITFGLESGDNDILKMMKKGITVEQARQAIQLTKKFGIGTHASFIIGSPGDNLQTINKTIEFAKELDTDYAQFSIATPFPGTEMWEMAKKQGIIMSEDFSKFTWYYSPVFETKEFDAEQLKEIQKEAYRTYKQGKQGK